MLPCGSGLVADSAIGGAVVDSAVDSAVDSTAAAGSFSGGLVAAAGGTPDGAFAGAVGSAIGAVVGSRRSALGMPGAFGSKSEPRDERVHNPNPKISHNTRGKLAFRPKPHVSTSAVLQFRRTARSTNNTKILPHGSGDGAKLPCSGKLVQA